MRQRPFSPLDLGSLRGVSGGALQSCVNAQRAQQAIERNPNQPSWVYSARDSWAAMCNDHMRRALAAPVRPGYQARPTWGEGFDPDPDFGW